MELLKYRSNNKKNLYLSLIIGVVIFYTLFYFEVVDMINFLQFAVLLLLLTIIFYIFRWHPKNKLIKFKDGEYTFADNGIEVSTHGKKAFLNYSNIQNVDYNYNKFKSLGRQIEGIKGMNIVGGLGFGFFILLNKIFLRSQMIEMQLVDKRYVRISVPLYYLDQVTKILQEKVLRSDPS